MNDRDFAHLLLALGLLLTAALAGGFLFQRLRQPRVIGEIAGGLLLGPTVLGAISPEWFAVVFTNGPTRVVLDSFRQIGLMLLMFCSGLEVRSEFPKDERKAAAGVTLAGTLLPFVFALAAGSMIDFSEHWGPAATPLSFNLIVAIAVAITSIPVISKIMMDLGILDTPFARVVLSSAVIEDVLLYVVLSVALALAVPTAEATPFGLAHMIGVPDGGWSVAYHVGATLLFFALAFLFGPPLYGRLARSRFNLVKRGSPAGYLLTFLIVFVGVAIFLEVQLMFGAFLAGVVAGTVDDDAGEARRAVKSFSSAFFIPIFFALVGWRLNLLRDVPWLFFTGFLVVACVVKALSVWLGARLAGVGSNGSWNLAAAMNARGGPGIVLATLALGAQIIDEGFYVCLVLLAILTSQMAGIWLNRAVRSGKPLL